MRRFDHGVWPLDDLGDRFTPKGVSVKLPKTLVENPGIPGGGARADCGSPDQSAATGSGDLRIQAVEAEMALPSSVPSEGSTGIVPVVWNVASIHRADRVRR